MVASNDSAWGCAAGRTDICGVAMIESIDAATSALLQRFGHDSGTFESLRARLRATPA